MYAFCWKIQQERALLELHEITPEELPRIPPKSCCNFT